MPRFDPNAWRSNLHDCPPKSARRREVAMMGEGLGELAGL